MSFYVDLMSGVLSVFWRKTMKMDWGRIIFIAIFVGIVMGLIAKSVFMGAIVGVCNMIGGLIYGAIFGRKDQA